MGAPRPGRRRAGLRRPGREARAHGPPHRPPPARAHGPGPGRGPGRVPPAPSPPRALRRVARARALAVPGRRQRLSGRGAPRGRGAAGRARGRGRPGQSVGWRARAEDAVARDEQRRLVQAALLTLPAREREAIVLRDIEGLSHGGGRADPRLVRGDGPVAGLDGAAEDQALRRSSREEHADDVHAIREGPGPLRRARPVDADVAAVEAHLGACPTCRSFLAALRASQAWVKDLAAEEIDAEALAAMRVRTIVAAARARRSRRDATGAGLGGGRGRRPCPRDARVVVALVSRTEPPRTVAVRAAERTARVRAAGDRAAGHRVAGPRGQRFRVPRPYLLVWNVLTCRARDGSAFGRAHAERRRRGPARARGGRDRADPEGGRGPGRRRAVAGPDALDAPGHRRPRRRHLLAARTERRRTDARCCSPPSSCSRRPSPPPRTSKPRAEDKAPGQAPPLVARRPRAPPRLRREARRGVRPGDVQKVFIIKHVHVNDLARILSVFPAELSGMERDNPRVLSVSAAPAVVAAIEETIKRLDVPPPPIRSVEITAYVLECASSGEAGILPQDLQGVLVQLRKTFNYSGCALARTLFARGSEDSRFGAEFNERGGGNLSAQRPRRGGLERAADRAPARDRASRTSAPTGAGSAGTSRSATARRSCSAGSASRNPARTRSWSSPRRSRRRSMSYSI